MRPLVPSVEERVLFLKRPCLFVERAHAPFFPTFHPIPSRIMVAPTPPSPNELACAPHFLLQLPPPTQRSRGPSPTLPLSPPLFPTLLGLFPPPPSQPVEPTLTLHIGTHHRQPLPRPRDDFFPFPFADRVFLSSLFLSFPFPRFLRDLVSKQLFAGSFSSAVCRFVSSVRFCWLAASFGCRPPSLNNHLCPSRGVRFFCDGPLPQRFFDARFFAVFAPLLIVTHKNPARAAHVLLVVPLRPIMRLSGYDFLTTSVRRLSL